MKKRKMVKIILNSNKPSTPSAAALAEASMHFTLNVQSAGSGQTGTF